MDLSPFPFDVVLAGFPLLQRKKNKKETRQPSFLASWAASCQASRGRLQSVVTILENMSAFFSLISISASYTVRQYDNVLKYLLCWLEMHELSYTNDLI